MHLQSTDQDYQTLKPARTFEIIGIIEKIRSIIGLEHLELLTLLDEASKVMLFQTPFRSSCSLVSHFPEHKTRMCAWKPQSTGLIHTEIIGNNRKISDIIEK